jgi:hypothetical protein
MALALLLAMMTGCTAPRYGLDSCSRTENLAPTDQQTVQSLRYRVRTDAGKPAAQEVNRFMERAAALWTPLFGVPTPATLPLEVRLHRDPADLVKVLVSQKLTATATGLYLPAPPPAVHVACWGAESGHPYRTLLHEGTHQFVHLGAGYRQPGRPATTPPSLALPLWLNEGLACYFEAAFLTPDLLQPGRPDPARLAELQNALRRGKAPPLGKLLTKRYGEPFTSLDYAAAWGVVYALMQEAPPPWAAGGWAWLRALIDEARRGWPTAALAPSATTAGDQQWWATITDQTHLAFATYTAERGLSIAAWEAQWRDWIVAHP